MSPDEVPTDLITMREACERLNVSARFMRQRVADGEVRAYRIGTRMLRVSLADVLALASPLPVMARGPRGGGRP